MPNRRQDDPPGTNPTCRPGGGLERGVVLILTIMPSLASNEGRICKKCRVGGSTGFVGSRRYVLMLKFVGPTE